MNNRIALTFSLFSFFVFSSFAQHVLPGHAHNDYLNKPALFEAVDARLVSVEADIHFMKGELYVAHIRPLRRNKKRSLENLYLKPLFEHIEKNEGKVYPNYDGPFYLMIDFKGGSVEMYDSLYTLLSQYKSMLTVMEGGILKPGAVTVFLSGSKPTQSVLKSEPKLCFLDGRPSDVGMSYSNQIMPVVSDHYKNHLKWNGKGKISDKEELKLRKLVSKVHAEGKKLRLWASPDNPIAWETFERIGVDLINTDKPKKFAEFMNLPTQ
ncbi:MAG: hypothetical protein ACPGU4_06320 [Flavobacteriales bacterium]